MSNFAKEQLQGKTIKIVNTGLKRSWDTKIFEVETGEEITNIKRIQLDIQPEIASIVAEITLSHKHTEETITLENVHLDIDAITKVEEE